MALELTADQRNALYQRLYTQLNGFDDLFSCIHTGDLEAAYRTGRRMLDALRLLQEELGWETEVGHPKKLQRIPTRELRSILIRVEGEAEAQYEDSREEREEGQREVALVRDTCRDLIPRLEDEGSRMSG